MCCRWKAASSRGVGQESRPRSWVGVPPSLPCLHPCLGVCACCCKLCVSGREHASYPCVAAGQSAAGAQRLVSTHVRQSDSFDLTFVGAVVPPSVNACRRPVILEPQGPRSRRPLHPINKPTLLGCHHDLPCTVNMLQVCSCCCGVHCVAAAPGRVVRMPGRRLRPLLTQCRRGHEWRGHCRRPVAQAVLQRAQWMLFGMRRAGRRR
jgi:hypothetical protein